MKRQHLTLAASANRPPLLRERRDVSNGKPLIGKDERTGSDLAEVWLRSPWRRRRRASCGSASGVEVQRFG